MMSSIASQGATGGASAYPGFPDLDESARLGHGEEWVREFFERLWRGKPIILTVAALGVLAALLFVSQITPRYSAKAMILVGMPKRHVVDVEDVLQGLRTDRATMESEIEVLTSRSLAAKVAEKLDLVEEPAFNPKLRPPRRSILAMLNPLNWLPSGWRAALSGRDAVPARAPSPEERARRTRQAVTARVMHSLRARIEGRSRVIAVTATSTEPRLAAAVANTLSDLYLVEQLETKFEATQRAADWLNKRVEELRRQVESSERAVDEYRQRHGLIQSNDTTVTEQQISGATNQLIAARAQTAEAGARLRQVRSLLDAGDIESASDVLASPVIQKLREQETDVARRAAEMATVFGPRHPRMISVREEVEEIRGKLATEVEKIVRSLDNELEVARIREKTLEDDLETLKSETERLSAAQGRLRVLEREAAANRTLFDTFLGRWKETGGQDEIQYADARILSRAVVPGAPSSPRTFRILVVALAFSLVLGIVLVYLVEHLDSGFRGAEQVERASGLGVLSTIPLARSPHSTMRPIDYLLAKAGSAFAESFRTLHTSLQLAAGGGKTILVASSIPQEGKTTVALGLAWTLAQAGYRTLLIDADLRRNEVATALGLRGRKGLAGYLAAATEKAPDIVQRDEKTGIDAIVSGEGLLSNSVDHLRSQRMMNLLDACRSQYDFIILDSPPTQLLSDSRILARLVERVVYVVRWAGVRREVALNSLKLLNEAAPNVAGCVLNAADPRKSGRYGYNYHEYGQARYYKRYYAD